MDDWCVKESETFDESKEIYTYYEFGKKGVKIDDLSNSLRQVDSNIEFKECICSCHSVWL